MPSPLLLYYCYFQPDRTKQSMWLVIWRFRNLSFVCVKQQRVGFWVITVLQSLEKVIALLSLSFEVFFFFNCYPVLLFSPARIKWRKHSGCWRRVGFFVVFAGIFLEVLMSCYILPLFLHSCPLSLFFFCHYNIHVTAASKPEHMAVTCVQAGISYGSNITQKLQLQTRKQLEVSYDMTVSVYWCVDQ